MRFGASGFGSQVERYKLTCEIRSALKLLVSDFTLARKNQI
jgi:hypothetical protein